MSVWLVISAYRNDNDVLRILDQVHASSEQPFERILVVDSLGTGVIPSIIEQRKWNDVIYRSYPYNLGSGANLHERLRIAAEGGADFVYTLNHDANFDLHAFSRLFEKARTIENLGAAYPLSHISTVGRYNLTGTRELPLPAKLVASPPKGPLLDAFWSSCNGALYSTVPVKKGVVPWDALWMGWEDLEYGWRLQSHGYRQVIVCDAIFQDEYEYMSTPLGNLVDKPAWRSYYHIRNLILAVRRSRNRPLFYLVTVGRFFQECVAILLARREKWKRLRFLWSGAVDGIRGIEGEQPC
jgi:GT2 family glycosyltransferase